MSYIIVTRNPSNGKLLIISTGDDDNDPAEFQTEAEAFAVAGTSAICRAWGAEIVPIDR